MKEALFSFVATGGIYSVLSQLLPEKEEVRRAVGFLFSVVLLLLLFRPFFSPELWDTFESFEHDIEENAGIGDGEDYKTAVTQEAYLKGVKAALIGEFGFASEEITVEGAFTDGEIAPLSLAVTLSGDAALSDLVSVERYGKHHILENFEVRIHR